MEFIVLNYLMKIHTPLRVGSGVQIGNLHELNRNYLDYEGGRFRRFYVSGNTLRGLIGLQLLRIYCRNRVERVEGRELLVDPVCTSRDEVKCKYSSDCPFYSTVLDWKHGKGVIFHFGVIEDDDLDVQTLKFSTIDRSTRCVVHSYSPFMYQAIISKRGYVTLKSKIVVLNEDLVEPIKKALSLTRYQCLGGRRSWGWGLIDYVEFEKKRISISGEVVERKCCNEGDVKVVIRLKTPLVIQGQINDLRNYITCLVNELAQKYFSKELDILSLKFLDPLRLIITSWWVEGRRIPYRNYAIDRGTRIELQVKLSEKDLKLIDIIGEYIGLSVDNQWSTKCGYGIYDILENMKYLRTAIREEKSYT